MGLSCSRNRASLSSAVRYWTAKSEPGEHASELQECAMLKAEELFSVNSKRSFQSVYCNIKTVSYGASSTVVCATHRGLNKTVACKIIPKLKSSCHVVMQRKLRLRVLSEIAAMKTVEAHRNAAKLLEVYEDDKNFYLVMEYYSGGELFEHIVRRKGGFNEDHAATIMRNILDFLAYSHSLGVVHADIKPENIVFSKDGPEGELMVLDFGLSLFCNRNETHKNVFGTLGYCSPEMANDVTGQKTDVWSAGVLLYFLLSGKPPFRYANRAATLCRLKNRPKVSFTDDVWDLVSAEAKEFVRSLLNPCSKSRVSASEALRLKWLQDSLHTVHPKHKLQNLPCESLKVFGKLSRLKRMVWERIARNAPHNLVGDQLAQFRTMDLDGNGVVDYDELAAVLSVARPDLCDDDFKQVFAAMDVDQSGFIDSSEYIAATITLLDPMDQEEITMSSFRRLDPQGSGFIPRDEMRDALLKELSAGTAPDDSVVADLDTEIETMDANGDGVISFEEFKCAMTDMMTVKMVEL